MKNLLWLGSILFTGLRFAWATPTAELKPVVEIEEDIYTYTNAHNGAGPMWCHGSTCLVRVGDRVFASGLEMIPGVPPLSNCRWMLFERRAEGWQRVRVDAEGRTREPSPLAAFHDGRVFLSANPAFIREGKTNREFARPDVLEFKANDATALPKSLLPVWRGDPEFTAYSYRSLAADGAAGELILFQNIDSSHAEWTFRNRRGQWSAQGQLQWPWGAEYDPPEPIRVCYPNVALRGHAVYFCGVGDIVEPVKAWRDYKRELTGREWDYAFRRLFYTWTPDVRKTPFAGWIEIASREKTCGWISPGDLYVSPNGDVYVAWSEQAFDERLRMKFFPQAKQSHTMNLAVIRDGKVIRRQIIEKSTEDDPGIVGSSARFQVTPEQRLFLAYYASGTDANIKIPGDNRVCEILRDGTVKPSVRLPLRWPMPQFFTATVRAGSPPSRTLEMLGPPVGRRQTIGYVRVKLY